MLFRWSLVAVTLGNYLLGVQSIPAPLPQDIDDVAPILSNLARPELATALIPSAVDSALETPDLVLSNATPSESSIDDNASSTPSTDVQSLSSSSSTTPSPSTTDHDQHGDGGFSIKYIIPVIVVGSLLLLATIFGWIYGRGRRAKSRRDPHDPHDKYYDNTYRPKGGGYIWNRFTSNDPAENRPKYGIPDEQPFGYTAEKYSYDGGDEDDYKSKYSTEIDTQEMLAEGRTGVTREEHEFRQHSQNSLGQMANYVMESFGSAKRKCRDWCDKTLPRVPENDFLSNSVSARIHEDPPASPQTMALKPTRALRVKVKERPLGSGKSNVSTKASSTSNDRGDSLISPQHSRTNSRANKTPDHLSGSPRSHAKGNLVRFSQVRRAQKAKKGASGSCSDSSTLVSSAPTSSSVTGSSEVTGTTAASYDTYQAPTPPKAVFSTPPRIKAGQNKYHPVPTSTPTRNDLPGVLQPRGSPGPAPLSPPKNPALFYSSNLNASTQSTDSLGQGNGAFSLSGMANLLFPSADRPSQMPTSPTDLRVSTDRHGADLFGSRSPYDDYRPRSNTHSPRDGTVSKSRKLSRKRGESTDETISRRGKRLSHYGGEEGLRTSQGRRTNEKIETRGPSQTPAVSASPTDRVEQIIRRGQIKRALEQPSEGSDTGYSGASGYTSGSSRIEALQQSGRLNGHGQDRSPRRAQTIGSDGLHNQATYSFSTRPNPFS